MREFQFQRRARLGPSLLLSGSFVGPLLLPARAARPAPERTSAVLLRDASSGPALIRAHPDLLRHFWSLHSSLKACLYQIDDSAGAFGLMSARFPCRSINFSQELPSLTSLLSLPSRGRRKRGPD